ncbi:cysteine conjugate beta-lyase,aminotransferase-like protein [Leishmania major strain Friedlin]|uniref:Cysteine conjugate beta-lyase,aminotransferase-like protein n=1 Tax=Leishmania major TaxID=5664 RepID=Q4Q455_LEIMA|nr:cysteine conjugate beta-lyase,aminotransferase-like protein [Leishmania major strain Friedlin]CAG9580710.1 glutamine_aminotransferase_-_putative [Leishmania major strain Friedlin]CAJ06325.1 cysteine conjugate beta-lyase,aminotransferase-like protein [Leishmania major strain Friedlin]|eukprot:XP_001685893.1 cysteine conjugate beta-lyase,aminotransferase-like protein [Leishmania major strain Friedlin]
MSKICAAQRLRGLSTSSIWEEMTPLANKHKAVNLGQGFPSFAPPRLLLEELEKVVQDSEEAPLAHQYCPPRGNAELVAQLCKSYTKLLSQDIQPSNVVVTNGVTQALNAIFQAFINQGDEVVLVEPFYDAYYQDIFITGGVTKYVSLQPSTESAENWKLTREALLEVVSAKTKFILINTPQNVPGKVWNVEELQIIAEVAKQFDAVVISDEVYMYLTYGKPHVSIASLPDMWERTVTLCSAGKTFSCTGWKIGWAVGCAKLTAPIAQIVSYQSFCCSTPFQIAIARAAAKAAENGFYDILRDEYAARVAQVSNMLAASGLCPVKPQGGFFALADITKVDPKHYYDASNKSQAKDWQFCIWLTKKIGVCAIPVTAFCQEESKPLYENYVRFACCRSQSELNAAAERLQKLQDYLL